jgi:hypothetical protein
MEATRPKPLEGSVHDSPPVTRLSDRDTKAGPSENKELTMFEVGKRYTIKMWEDGEEGGVLVHYDECEVVEIVMPLIKISQPTGEEVIVNTASLAFVQATLELDDEADDEVETETSGS